MARKGHYGKCPASIKLCAASIHGQNSDAAGDSDVGRKEDGIGDGQSGAVS